MTDVMLVCDLMSRHVVTIGMDDTLQTARELFDRHGFHHLIVVEGRKTVGVVSDRDLLRNLSPFLNSPLTQRSQDLSTLNRRIHQIMTRRLVRVSADRPAVEAARMMIDENVSCLPVMEEGERLAGIITLRDVARWFTQLVIENETRTGRILQTAQPAKSLTLQNQP